MLAFEQLGVETLYLRPEQLASLFGRRDSRIVYTSTLGDVDIDAVLLRDIGFPVTLEIFLRRYTLFKHFELLGKPVVNPVDGLVTARNKYLSLLLLDMNGIPVPRTAVVEDVSSAMRIAERFGTTVIKPIVGSMGFGAIKVDNIDIAYVVSRTLSQVGQPIYIQEFVEKPSRDIRVFVVGNQVIAAYYRVQESSWKTNIAQGAKPVAMNRIDPELEELAIKATKVLSLHYAGVDVAETRDGYVVFEVNASPNWRGLMVATGVNPATHIARYVVQLVRR